MSSSAPVWFITGASSGLGLAAVKHVLAKGGRVIAAVRKPEVLNELVERYPASRLAVTRLDVTDALSVQAAFDFARDTFGQIDVVYNNAGVFIVGEAEGTPLDAAKQVFEVNFWAAIVVSRQAVRFFREVNPKGHGGILLQAGSGQGLSTLPASSIYSASKHALDAFTQALFLELRPEWNIKVVIVEFGAFESNIANNAAWTDIHPAYLDPTTGKSTARALFDSPFPQGKAEAAVVPLWKVAQLENPPLRLLVGKDCIGFIKDHLGKLHEEITTYESWSEDLDKIPEL